MINCHLIAIFASMNITQEIAEDIIRQYYGADNSKIADIYIASMNRTLNEPDCKALPKDFITSSMISKVYSKLP